MNVLLSHPDKLLIDHLCEVATIATRVVSGKGYRFVLANSTEITQQQLTDLVWIAGAFHDLAKATSYFQAYIRNPEGVHNHLKNHAQLSSIFTWFVAKEYCKKQFSDQFLSELIPALLLIAVKRHHGSIENLEKELSFSNDDLEYFSEQIRSIDNEFIELIISELLIDCKVKTTWKEFVTYWQGNTFQREMKDFKIMLFKFRYPKLQEPSRIALFNFFQVVYSALMYADKNDVILDENRFDPKQTDITNCLEEFRKEKGFNSARTEIDRLKNEAYFNTLEHLEKVFKSKQHLYSITLPTGLGKTLTAYAVADKLRQLSGNADAKIVINIPFTSIIDQNFEVYRQVLGRDSSDVLLKHHHLAEPNYKDGSERVYDFDKSQFLIETWQSETIVTTFVQFLETILSMDKTKLMKFANLRNSIVLLDEIQTIPYELWETVRKSFFSLGESMNMYFVLISATQPLIFTPGEDIFELVPDYQKYFRVFNRTRLHYQKEAVSFDSFVGSVSSYVFEETDKDVLVIMNTKKAARTCFEQLVNLNLDDTNYYFLSTLITPYERKDIIRKIKAKNGNRKLIVSTQLIEAGVDISVDTIFRQLSPIDSIIQSAGRANRYNEKKTISDIYLYEIDGEHQRTTSRIYGSDLILKTKNVLKDFLEIEETGYLQLIDRYFKEVRKQSDETSSSLLNAILGLRFAEVDMELIKERKTESVFIQLNEEAKSVWVQYISLYNTEGLTPWELKARFAAFKSKFYDYVINVPVPYDQASIDFDSAKILGFYVSPLDYPSSFYNYNKQDSVINTGYIPSSSIIL